MRIRTIKPDFWEHPVMSKQSDTTKLLAIGLLNVADDEGYFYAEPRMIRNAIRPLDDDSRITTGSLRELSNLGYISVKNHPTHGDIGFIPSFLNHQVINKPKPSKLKELYEYGNYTVLIRDEYRPERKGKEQGKEGISCPQADVLENIWNLSPSRAKSRSSKKQLSDAWKLIPNIDKPSEDDLKQSLNRWIQSDDWTKDDGKFIGGIHLWIKNRKWEVEPTPANQPTKKGVSSNGFGV
jgi:hypothetical protein